MTHFDSYRNTTCTRNFFMQLCCCWFVAVAVALNNNELHTDDVFVSDFKCYVTNKETKMQKKTNMKICCLFAVRSRRRCSFLFVCVYVIIVNIHWEIICRNANNRWAWHGRRIYLMGRSWNCFALFSFNTIELLPLFLLRISDARFVAAYIKIHISECF